MFDADVVTQTCSRIMALQRQRLFAVSTCVRNNQAADAFVVSRLRTAGVPGEVKALFGVAGRIRKAVVTGTAIPSTVKGVPDQVLDEVALIIRANAAGLSQAEDLRKKAEADMRALAGKLPAADFVASIRGLSLMGLAVVVGEAGDLGGYATRERLWKRLGLAVFDGLAQGRVPKGLPAAEAKAAWTLRGYSPRRRAAIWSVADPMFRHQWAAAKGDEAPAHAAGPYGAVYGRRKAATAGREDWAPARREADARRIMTKTLVADIHRQWLREIRA